jgi:squalene-hopene/tetraprenyl-beta-curcumene cyclase
MSADPSALQPRIANALAAARLRLLAERHQPSGIWRGQLSSSALSTATAVQALSLAAPDACSGMIRHGREWLAKSQHPTGGWGDTVHSKPNISTTLLVWAAFGAARAAAEEFGGTLRAAEGWIGQQAGNVSPPVLAAALARRYGRDKTFSVPILMACALGGRLGPSPDCWALVPQLPFQLAALPRSWFAAVSLPVVSYALPALIAIGQVRHFHRPGGPGRFLRAAAVRRTQDLLVHLQPEGGGFLEATPLTSFVTMALAGMNLATHPVALKGVEFLTRSCRADGSWPIDTDLATWATTLAVKALGADAPSLCPQAAPWLLGQQYRQVHPYTLSPPGGWAWTDLPGGVPDADDTSGALLALAQLDRGGSEDFRQASAEGAGWLLGLQNRDGGMPTFCRGWGALPFDRSTPEITAHALAAWRKWPGADPRIPKATQKALAYLRRVQTAEGAWLPLWFGNEWSADENNPVYGTAATLRDLLELDVRLHPSLPAMLVRAAQFLVNAQRPCGGWGAVAADSPAPPQQPSLTQSHQPSVEETALALHALAGFCIHSAAESDPALRRHAQSAVARGTDSLLELTREGTHFPAAPIGLYFARLWYAERLYPIIWTCAALRAVQHCLQTR